MSNISLLTPLLRPLTLSSHRRPLNLPTIPRRGHQTARRNRKALNIPPAPSLGGPTIRATGSSGRSHRSRTTPLVEGDTIVFNPPSAAPNVYHTPPIFLPPSDPRRNLVLNDRAASGAAAFSAVPSRLMPEDASEQTPLPPAVRQYGEKKYHLGPKEIKEMRALRTADSQKWTRKRLQERFKCSNYFVATVVEASEDWKRRERERVAERMSVWGAKRRGARLERRRRKDAWGRGE